MAPARAGFTRSCMVPLKWKMLSLRSLLDNFTQRALLNRIPPCLFLYLDTQEGGRWGNAQLHSYPSLTSFSLLHYSKLFPGGHRNSTESWGLNSKSDQKNKCVTSANISFEREIKMIGGSFFFSPPSLPYHHHPLDQKTLRNSFWRRQMETFVSCHLPANWALRSISPPDLLSLWFSARRQRVTLMRIFQAGSQSQLLFTCFSASPVLSIPICTNPTSSSLILHMKSFWQSCFLFFFFCIFFLR